MKNKVKCVIALAVGVALLPVAAQAQITNTAAGVETAIVGGISTVYDDAVSVGVGAIAVGMAIYFIRKGLKARA